MKYTLIIIALLFAAGFIAGTKADPEVKYCKNFETGEIIVIEEGYPCPFPTAEI